MSVTYVNVTAPPDANDLLEQAAMLCDDECFGCEPIDSPCVPCRLAQGIRALKA